MKKFGCGCVMAIAIVVALGICIVMFAPDAEDNAIQSPSVEQLSPEDFKTEIANGETVLAWLKKDDKLTDLQKDEQFKQFKGKNIIIRGVVEETGKATLSFSDEIYVALKVGDVNWLEEIHIQFTVAERAETDAKSLRKGQQVVMRGHITSNKGIETAFVKLVCDKSEIVSDTKYKEILSQH